MAHKKNTSPITLLKEGLLDDPDFLRVYGAYTSDLTGWWVYRLSGAAPYEHSD